MNIASNCRVVVFLFYNQYVISKVVSVEKLMPDSLGVIDSPYLHITEWESNLNYLPQFPGLYGSEYQELPRGRVLFDLNAQVFKVIMDESIFNKRKINLIKTSFGLGETTVKYYTDPH
ncbi:MAG: hypothetical protein HWE10_05935 [Gammaproteobacteria bacterium]|nr:hypothetical protein [Gammaproteobacteria bacterium]